MKLYLLIALLSTALFGLSNDIKTFSADFKQTVTDDKNQKLEYNGHVWSQRPQNALWHYTSPINKKVYIAGQDVIIIEPDLEQAIIKKIDKDIDLNAILSQAKKVDMHTYEAEFDGKHFTLKENEGKISSISYKDSFDNLIDIEFTNQQQDEAIDEQVFEASIPADYDVIR